MRRDDAVVSVDLVVIEMMYCVLWVCKPETVASGFREIYFHQHANRGGHGDRHSSPAGGDVAVHMSATELYVVFVPCEDVLQSSDVFKTFVHEAHTCIERWVVCEDECFLSWLFVEFRFQPVSHFLRDASPVLALNDCIDAYYANRIPFNRITDVGGDVVFYRAHFVAKEPEHIGTVVVVSWNTEHRTWKVGEIVVDFSIGSVVAVVCQVASGNEHIGQVLFLHLLEVFDGFSYGG